MSLDKKKLGKLGEVIASKYLTKRGFKLIDRNFKIRYGEIDLIFIYQKKLIFVEVKTRRTSYFGAPADAVTPWKIQTLIKTAHYYKLTHQNLPDSLRIDVVAITIDDFDKPVSIDHIPNITL